MQFCPVDEASRGLLKAAMAQLHLSPQAYYRILKLARTIANLAGSEQIQSPLITEVIRYRPQRQV